MPAPLPQTPFSLGLHAALDSLRLRLCGSSASSPLPSCLSLPISSLTTLLHTSLTSSTFAARSALLLGAPAAGKSLVLTRALADLDTHHAIRPTVVTLHGLLHASPGPAWRSVASQLSAADAIAAPADIMECQAVIRAALDRMRESHIPLLLVLDALHLFAVEPLAQNVLYALLNLLQDAKLRAACVAMTPHVDVEDALEKRVKSRFAAREIVVPLVESKEQVVDYLTEVVRIVPSDFEMEQPERHIPAKEGQAVEDVEAPVRVSSDESSSDDGERPRRSRRTRRRPKKRKKRVVVDLSPEASLQGIDALAEAEFERGVREFDAVAHKLVESPGLVRLVARHLQCTRVLAPLLRAFDGGLVSAFGSEMLGDFDADVGHKEVKTRVNRALAGMEELLFPSDALAETMGNLSVVELGLLASLRRVERGGAKAVRFGEVFGMYETLRRSGEGLLAEDDGEVVANREVAEKSWERLVEGGLVARGGRGPRHMRGVGLNVEAEEVDRAVEEHEFASTRLKRWARGEVRR